MRILAVLPLLLCVGCCGSKSSSDSGSRGGKDITITAGPDGGMVVSGGNPLKGDPKSCAAYRACCSAPSMGLYCGLLQSTDSDCAALLPKARAYLKETNEKPPAGCM